jgi:hypothetical protein
MDDERASDLHLKTSPSHKPLTRPLACHVCSARESKNSILSDTTAINSRVSGPAVQRKHTSELASPGWVGGREVRRYNPRSLPAATFASANGRASRHRLSSGNESLRRPSLYHQSHFFLLHTLHGFSAPLLLGQSTFPVANQSLLTSHLQILPFANAIPSSLSASLPAHTYMMYQR